jgi:hypothetical protein
MDKKYKKNKLLKRELKKMKDLMIKQKERK